MIPLNVATQVEGMMLHVLPKVELISACRNDCGNKNVARNGCDRVWVFPATCVAT